MSAFSEKPDGERYVFTVAEIVCIVNEDLKEGYGSVWVQGEVGEISFPRSGHVYFSLKDESDETVLSAVMFKPYYTRRKFDLEAGRRVIVNGYLTIYPPRGSFQVVVKSFTDVGAGLLARQFEALKRKLMEEGLTSEERKRPVPELPGTIGIVTSLEAAALQDMLRILRGRFPARVVISPAMVQGGEAPGQLVRALDRLTSVEDIDVVIIGRGGGSAEDLAAFNDEQLARAVAACPVPVISAVGHEVDVTISDLVADVRAPTPTAAAQIVIPSRDDIEARLRNLEKGLSRSTQASVAKGRNLLYALRERLSSPERMIMNRRQRIDELTGEMIGKLRGGIADSTLHLERLSVSLSHLHPGSKLERQRDNLRARTDLLRQLMRQRLQRSNERLSIAGSRLEALSPLGVLSRGYAIATRKRDRAVIKSSGDVEDGEGLDLRVHEGVIPCVVKKDG